MEQCGTQPDAQKFKVPRDLFNGSKISEDSLHESFIDWLEQRKNMSGC